MTRHIATALTFGAICFGAWTGLKPATYAAEGGADAAALQSDTTLQVALAHKDAKAAGALLDQDFSWTNDAGMTRKKAQFLTDAAAGSVIGDTEYTNLKAKDYGDLAVVTGIGKRTGHNGTV